MYDHGLPDDLEMVADARDDWDEGQSVRDRVYETVIQLYEPAPADEVAERARCSTGAARDHLEWFAGRGIVTVVEGRPRRYRRNQSYFDWKRAHDLRREYSDAELQERVNELTETERAYREKYQADAPSDVDALEHTEYDDIDAVWRDVADWQTVRRELRLLEYARKDRTSVGDVPG